MNGSLIFGQSDFDKVWFTSDHHFGHENIIKYCKRPFESAVEMDETLIRNWNQKIMPDDIVFHLGDFTLGDAANRYFGRLNGRVYFLKLFWHHDKRWLNKNTVFMTKKWYVEFLPPIHIIYVQGLQERNLPITLIHYPLAEWEASHHGALQLHGHSHGNHSGGGRLLDVGIDCHEYFPISLGEVIAKLWKS